MFNITRLIVYLFFIFLMNACVIQFIIFWCIYSVWDRDMGTKKEFNFEREWHRVGDSNYHELQEDTNGYSPCHVALRSHSLKGGHLSLIAIMLLCWVDQPGLTFCSTPFLIQFLLDVDLLCTCSSPRMVAFAHCNSSNLVLPSLYIYTIDL